MSASSGRPVCLALEPDHVLAFLHSPEGGEIRSTAVLICPPFGWEEMCSYRARRRWAEALAQAGYPAARLDLPSAGDSGGSPGDPARIDAWISAVSGAAAWLRASAGADRVAVVGIGLGGMVAHQALVRGAPIDDVVLWAVPARGRTLLRELRAHSAVIAARQPADARNESEEANGGLELIGYALSAETARELSELDLTASPLPSAAGRRALLVGRDRLPVDRRLREQLEQAGVAVELADGSDYSLLVEHPQEARTPEETIARTIAWLAEPAAGNGNQAPAAPSTSIDGVQRESLELVRDGLEIRETPIEFELEEGRLIGILTEPVGAPAAVCAVLLGAGALRRTGPNRTWVECARRWAAHGVPTLRVDLRGIGDSDGDEHQLVPNPGLYAPGRVRETLAVLDALAAHELPNRFVLGGLCSGAYWSLHAALADKRVVGALMINLYSLFWSEELVAERETRAALTRLRGRAWRRLLRRDVSRAQVSLMLRSMRPGRIWTSAKYPVEAAQTELVERALDQLRDQGTEALLLLSQREQLYDQLERQGQLEQLDRWPNLALERIPSSDHMFRALWLQRYVQRQLDRALERVLISQGARQ